MPSPESREEALRAHKAALTRAAEAAKRANDIDTLEMSQLLIRQCDFLIERAQREDRDLNEP